MIANEESLAGDFKSVLKKTIKKSISKLLKPLGIVILPLGALWENFVLDVCDKDSKQNLKDFNIKGFFSRFNADNTKILLIGIGIFLLILFFLWTLWIIVSSRNTWIKTLQEDNKRLKSEYDDLQEKTKVYKAKESINIKTNVETFMEEFVETTECVEAIQIHNYNFSDDEETEYMIYYIEFDKQYLRSGKKHYLNAITNYYKINYSFWVTFNQILEYLDENHDNLTQDKKQEISEFLDDLLEDKTNEHIRMYKVLSNICTQLNFEEDNAALEQVATSKDNDIDNNAYNEKRTGILGAALIGGKVYEYSYDKENSKKKSRIYYSFCDTINKENKLITIIVNQRLYRHKSNSNEKLLDNIIENYNSTKYKYNI